MGQDELPAQPDRHTMARLEAAKHTSTKGTDYWRAREIAPILGYETWRNFQAAIERAIAACAGNGLHPDYHFAETSKLVALASDAKREVTDYFLTRAACYLIAMNGDPTKPEIAAAQAYFAAQTRRMEIEDQKSEDIKRLEARERVSQSHRRVSSAAKNAGVRNNMQGVFHDAGSKGLYGLSRAQVKRRKGLADADNLYDHAGALELSANEFHNNLSADVIGREGIKREQAAIDRHQSVGREVRDAMEKSGARMPEDLPLAPEPIAVVKRRVKAQERARLSKPSNA